MSLASISAERAYEIGRDAYPAIDPSRDAFIMFAAARAETWKGNPDRAADMFLACACVERVPAAVAEFLAAFGERITHCIWASSRAMPTSSRKSSRSS